MGKIRRGNFIFITWKGNHGPRHVHVFRESRLIVKWDLENHKPMTGQATARILEIIGDLKNEGKL